MNTNLLSFIRLFTNRSETDVFKNTQGRLTRIYSGLLILFLTVFIVIVFSVLYIVVVKTQEQDLQTLVDQEARFIESDLWENNKSDLPGYQNQEVVFAGVNQFFYYVVDENGEMQIGNEADHRLRPDLLHLVNTGFHKGSEVRHETLQARNNPNGRGKRGEFHPPDEGLDIRLMIASQSLYDKGQFVGKLYVGKDITFIYQLFGWLMIVFAALGVIFIGVALLLSVKMSKRAMIPISRAFSRQREFVADASHELRTPLSVLLSSIDAMEMTIEPEGMVAKLLTNMRQEVKRMTHLVSELLTLARSDSNTVGLRTEVFDFRPLAEKALESVRPLGAAKQIKLGLSAPDVLPVIADPERMSQLLYILLDNAIKYTPNGGEVKLCLSKNGNVLGIVVQDTGIGINQEDHVRIFERFYRADKSRSRQAGGHGLGLPIAKWIVDTHKGSIKVTSVEGKGSKFEVRVPDTNN